MYVSNNRVSKMHETKTDRTSGEINQICKISMSISQ